MSVGLSNLQKRAWVTRTLEAFGGPAITCQFHTRVVIPGDRTPSGTRYDFQSGESRDDVLAEDVDYLLSLIYEQSACCGGNPGKPIHYFSLEGV